MDLKNLIGSGAMADFYEYEGHGVKLFKQGADVAHIYHEASVMSILENTGLPIPKVTKIVNINGRWAIVMDLADGKPVAYDMTTNMDNFVDLQLKMHSITAPAGFVLSNSHYMCRKIISESQISLVAEKRELLIELLDSFPVEFQLCHNDYHGRNVLKTKNGLVIIDWVSATSGSPKTDCCRTYMLTKACHEEFAEPYLENVCEKAKFYADDILKWLPVLSAVWLHMAPENHFFNEWLSRLK